MFGPPVTSWEVNHGRHHPSKERPIASMIQRMDVTIDLVSSMHLLLHEMVYLKPDG